MRHWSTRYLAVLAVILLAACGAQQTAYLGAEDIRRQREPSGLDRHRLIYSGVYTKQVRVYEITPSRESDCFDVRIEISGQPDLPNIVIGRNNVDLPALWRPAVTATRVLVDQNSVMVWALATDALFGPLAEGLELSSIDFHWAAACRGGKFHCTSYLWPDEGFKSLAFPQVLAAWDFTGIAVNPPRKTDPLAFPSHDPDQVSSSLFQDKVGDNGLSNSLLELIVKLANLAMNSDVFSEWDFARQAQTAYIWGWVPMATGADWQNS